MSELYPDLPLSNFPSSVDSFPTWLDVVASDGPLIQQYKNALESGNSVLANQILQQIPSATQKLITSVSLNTLSQCILAVERFYSTNIESYINTLQENWTELIQQFSYKGVWASGTSYVTNNLVSYTVSGLTLIYIAIVDVPVGAVPTNTTYWRPFTIQGLPGISGAGFSYCQEWNSAVNYTTSDAVTYNGALWIALQPNINQNPSSDSDYWELVMNLEVTTYPIQNTEPVNLQVNGLWFNTQVNPVSYYYLSPLTNPAQASNIDSGFQAYDANGNLIVGTG